MALPESAAKTIIRPRQAVAQLSAYSPPLEGRRSFTRLDFNENTDPPALSVLRDASIYPEYDQFLSDLSKTLNVPEESLLLTNGSDEGLGVIAWTFIEPKVDTALTVTPTFALIPHGLRLAESHLVEIPYRADWNYDIEAIEAALSKGVKLAVFASPDNPVGAILPVNVLEKWLQKFPQTLFVMDEAYTEYAEQSALPLALKTPNLLVTRTFSKAWGLAGLRLGVVIGSPALIGEIKKVRSPYSVNIAAVEAASELLPSYPAILSQAQETMKRKQFVVSAIEAKGFQVIAGHGNFFMMGLGIAAKPFCDFMKSLGILVRDRSTMHPSLWGQVRVSVGTAEEMSRFLDALEQFSQRTALLFDLDGTLVDTTDSFDYVVETLIKKHSSQSLKDGELNALRAEGGFNDDWEATVELLKRRGVSVTFEQIADEGQALYLEIAKEKEFWLLDPNHLKALSQRFRLGIVTGRMCAEFAPIWEERMKPYFECIVCQDHKPGALKKPEPELLYYAIEALGTTGGFYVGNSVDDVKAALAAGLTPIAVATTLSVDCLDKAGSILTLPSPDTLARAFQVNC